MKENMDPEVKKIQCLYCGKKFKRIDARHLAHCKEYQDSMIVKMIYNSEKSIEKIAEESTSSVEEIKSLLKEYDNALELRMEQFKDKIGRTKKLFLEIEEGLKSLITQMPNIESSEHIKKNYCEVFDGEKWVDHPKRLGSKSFIIQKKFHAKGKKK